MAAIRWEYIGIKLTKPCGCPELERLGNDGWELVSVTSVYELFYAYLKREVR
jgi:hypothetical protein